MPSAFLSVFPENKPVYIFMREYAAQILFPLVLLRTKRENLIFAFSSPKEGKKVK